MSIPWQKLAALILIWICSVVPLTAFADSYTGRVVAIADGDTITVLDANQTQHKVRLAGIDAPEKRQAFGNVSRQHLAAAVFGRTVTVDWTKHDRYGREIGKILIGGKDANFGQIEAGLAWHYKRYEREQSAEDRTAYAAAEEAARAARRGLWQDAAPVAPWAYRHR